MIQTVKIKNTSGAYIEVSNYGAALIAVVVPNKLGILENIVLRYDNAEDYVSDSFYLGSTIGRFANRISKAQFMLNGKTYLLDRNDGDNSNHGGFEGFNKQVFDCQESENCVTFSYLSQDGECGFGGNLQLHVIYTFSEDNTLTIQYKALSDKETVFNPSNHAYFNLLARNGNILHHKLKVYADTYLESTDTFIPTGRVLNISETAFDFSEYKSFAAMIPLKKEKLAGYNTYFIGNAKENMKMLASLREEESGRQVDIYSTMPGIQVYTGDYLSEPFSAFGGVALEAQFYPDAPNQPHFPSCVIYPNTRVEHIIKYCFKLIENT